MLTCTHLKKRFREKVAVEDISFVIHEGEIFALLGRNGVGKTTTIKMILGLLPLDSGEVLVKEGVHIGYSPETPYFPPFLSGREVLDHYGRIQGLAKATLQPEIDRVMAIVGLEDSRIRVKNYSKGMLQRLAVAQALLGDPHLLILDEPTAGLDAIGRIEILRLLIQMKASGKTILLNSHVLGEVETVSDRAIIIDAGKTCSTWIKNVKNTRSLEEVFIESVGGNLLARSVIGDLFTGMVEEDLDTETVERSHVWGQTEEAFLQSQEDCHENYRAQCA